jgi:hypothetical protein
LRLEVRGRFSNAWGKDKRQITFGLEN